MRYQLERYFESTSPSQHHWGRKCHSTILAVVSIDLDHENIKELKETVVVILTDLNSAFNLVNHKTLLRKLEFHG